MMSMGEILRIPDGELGFICSQQVLLGIAMKHVTHAETIFARPTVTNQPRMTRSNIAA